MLTDNNAWVLLVSPVVIETPWVVQEEQRLPIMHLLHGEHGPRPRHQEAYRRQEGILGGHHQRLCKFLITKTCQPSLHRAFKLSLTSYTIIAFTWL